MEETDEKMVHYELCFNVQDTQINISFDQNSDESLYDRNILNPFSHSGADMLHFIDSKSS